MKTLRLFSLINLLVLNTLLAQKQNLVFRFYDETAYTISKGDFKFSLFKSAEYGLNHNLSISAHPVLVFINPSIDMMYNFYINEVLTVSSFHGLSYPTLILNTVKSSGTGGFISPEFKIPIMFSVRNGVMATYRFDDLHYLTGKLSFEFAINNSDLAPGTSIDIPIVLPRTMVYYKSTGFNLALASEGKIWKKFDYYTGAEFFVFPFGGTDYEREYSDNPTDFFIEINSGVFWNIGRTFKLGIIGKLCYGQYPFGTQWLLIPYLDFVKVVE